MITHIAYVSHNPPNNIFIMSRKVNGFFKHPKVMMKIPPDSPNKQQHLNPQELSSIQAKILLAKESQVSAKKQLLNQLREENARLELIANNYQSKSRSEQIELHGEVEELDRMLEEVEGEIASSQQLGEIGIEEYIQWRHMEAKRIHFERIQHLRNKYNQQNTDKIQQISTITAEVERAKGQLTLLEQQLAEEKAIIIPEVKEEEAVMPNVRLLGSELAYLREKVRNLRQNKKLITNQLKDQLNSNSWPVKKNFEESKQRIAKQMKKLLQQLQLPQKAAIPASPSAKTPNPLSLIEAYETRLSQLQQILPEELKTQQILKCLRPLPWRSIKGSGIDPSTSHATEIQQKFNKMQKDFVDLQARCNQLKGLTKDKDIEIDKLLQMLNETEEKIKQYRK